MMDLINRLTDKQDWEHKIFDDTITARWRAEVLAAPGRDVSGKMFDWVSRFSALSLRHRSSLVSTSCFAKKEVMLSNCLSTKHLLIAPCQCIAEIRYKSRFSAVRKHVEAFDGGITKSDVAVPEHLRRKLCQAVAPLENIPDHEKDWHPESKHQVLDLVHPSLYPLVYGQSRILPGSTIALNQSLITSAVA